MKWSVLTILIFFLTGCAGPAEEPLISQGTTTSNLPDYGAAPELTNEIWLNTTKPLRLADLRAKVVLLDMWTFG
jgi:hypothetical protein